jgi:CRP/FNR family transcriptional regulator, cyclic AMP receptor protein
MPQGPQVFESSAGSGVPRIEASEDRMRHKIKPVPEKNDQVLSALSQIPIFDSLKGDECRTLVQHMGYFKAAAGDLLFEEGDDGDHVCFVVSGSLEVLKDVDEEKHVTIATLKKGRSFGEMAIIDKLKRSATVKAQEDTNVLVMSREQLDDILTRYPALGIKILKGIAMMLSQNLRKTATRLADYMLPLG